MHRSARFATAIVLALVATAMLAEVPHGERFEARAQEGPQQISVKARLSGWVARRDGFHLYREGATVRMIVGVWPNLRGESVRARLEWRRSGTGWRLLDVSSTTLNRDSRGLFLVRGLPAGSSFRIRAKVPARRGHGPGRSPWRYFRVR